MKYPDGRNCPDQHNHNCGCNQCQGMFIPVERDPCQRIAPVIIPHVKVRNFSEARTFPNSYVFIELSQQWAHIDEFGNVATLSNAYLFRNNFDAEANVGLFRNIQVFDFAAGKSYIYNNTGQYASFELAAPINSGDEEGEE